jgi:hypothetical protein
MMPLGLDGPGQLSPRLSFGFIEFMRDVCDDQVDDMTNALNTLTLPDRRNRVFHSNEPLRHSGVRPTNVPALLALLTQGSMSPSDSKIFSGLSSRQACDERSKRITRGEVRS